MTHGILLEFLWLERLVRLGSALQNPRTDLLVSIFFISDGVPVDRLVLAHWEMHNSELSIISELTHLPLKIVLIVF